MVLRDRRSRVRRPAVALLAGLSVTTLALSACASDDSGSSASDGKLTVVASTSVWGSVAQAVAGDTVTVESIVSDPSADPHSYESSPRDAAKVNDADLVVYNGGGYDPFIDQILSTTQDMPTVRAVPGDGGHEHGGHQQGHAGHETETGHAEHGGHGHGEQGHGADAGHAEEGHGEHGHEHGHGANEHVWYDLHVVHETADRIADELGKLQPQRAQSFRDAAARFNEQVAGLEGQVEQIAARHSGKQVLATAPVADYLIEQAGLKDITPPEFVNAVEGESDPSASAVAQIQNAVRSQQAAILVYNPQTESPVTQDVRKAAEESGIPVVELTETPPPDQSYVRWMTDQITALNDALAR